MQKITPFLWFNDNAEAAINLYISTFKNSKILSVTRYGEAGPGPKGTVMTARFQLDGLEITALNGGPQFKFTPAVSFFVSCTTSQEVDQVWKKLSEAGTVLVELDKYPFSEKFGWVQDKFGLSWQLNLGSHEQKITPFLMFVGKPHGKAEQAMSYYTSLFKNSNLTGKWLYGPGEGGSEGTVKHARFTLDGQEFMTMDSNKEHQFSFSEAVSFVVNCKTQEEVDEYWEKLSEGGQTQMCGWLKDKYGLSWQVVPTALSELLQDRDPEKSKRVMQAMLQMKKIDIKGLRQAYESADNEILHTSRERVRQ